MFCGKCGKEVPNHMKFCIHCGANLDEMRQTKGSAIVDDNQEIFIEEEFYPDLKSSSSPVSRQSRGDRTPSDAIDIDIDFPPSTKDLSPGTKLCNNRYEVLKILGRGGMGVVYMARDIKLDNRVIAIKVLPKDVANHKKSLAGFKREILISSELRHENIMAVYHFEEDGEDIKFFTMEYIDGPTLDDLLAEKGKATEEEIRKWAFQICDALQHAHEKRIIHRDIKPSNIMLNSRGVIKITDFGVARVLKDSLTHLTGERSVGTFLYMSPDQLNGIISEQSDVYSVGATLYELLSGRPPFWTGDIREQIRRSRPQPIENASPEMNKIILKALEKDRNKRFASASELKKAFLDLEAKYESDSLQEEDLGQLDFPELDDVSKIDQLIEDLYSDDIDNQDNARSALIKLKEKAVEPLISSLHRLSAEDIEQQYLIIDVFSRIGAPSLKYLIKALREGEANVRVIAAWSLGEIGDKRSAPYLVQALKDSEKDVRIGSALALGSFKEPKAFDSIVNMLQDPDEDVREAAAQALAQYGNKQAAGPLIYSLRDPCPGVRATAARALGSLGDKKAVDALVEALSDSDTNVTLEAACSLGYLEDRRAVVALVGGLRRANAEDRLKSAVALSYIKDKRAIPALVSLATIEPDPDIRFAALDVLVKIDDPKAEEAVVLALQDTVGENRILAAQKLKKSTNPDVQKRVRKILNTASRE